MMRKILLIGAIVLIVLVVGSIFFTKKPAPQGVDKWSRGVILQSIVRDRPFFTNNGRPFIEIRDVTMPEEGWYIVTIASTRAAQSAVPVKIILAEQNTTLRVIVGPEVDFPEYITDTASLPDSVIMELRKS